MNDRRTEGKSRRKTRNRRRATVAASAGRRGGVAAGKSSGHGREDALESTSAGQRSASRRLGEWEQTVTTRVRKALGNEGEHRRHKQWQDSKAFGKGHQYQIGKARIPVLYKQVYKPW